MLLLPATRTTYRRHHTERRPSGTTPAAYVFVAESSAPPTSTVLGSKSLAMSSKITRSLSTSSRMAFVTCRSASGACVWAAWKTSVRFLRKLSSRSVAIPRASLVPAPTSIPDCFE